jgi:hypothetical protein
MIIQNTNKNMATRTIKAINVNHIHAIPKNAVPAKAAVPTDV